MRLERTLLRTVIASLGGLLVGVLFLVLGANLESRWESILCLNVGSFLIASVVMALIFEHWQLRSLLDDLSAHVRGIDQIKRGGISGFSATFHDNVPWEQLFTESDRLELLVSYASTWRNAQQGRIERFLQNPDAKLTVILPDPDYKIGISELADRFEMAPDELIRRIQDASRFFQAIANGAKGQVRILYAKRSPVFTFYRFNTRAVFVSYRHRPGRGAVVTLLVERGGEFYEWLSAELDALTREGLASTLTRQVFPALPDRPVKGAQLAGAVRANGT